MNRLLLLRRSLPLARHLLSSPPPLPILPLFAPKLRLFSSSSSDPPPASSDPPKRRVEPIFFARKTAANLEDAGEKSTDEIKEKPASEDDDDQGYESDLEAMPATDAQKPIKKKRVPKPRKTRGGPKGPKYAKQMKGRMRGMSCGGGTRICFGKYGLRALEPSWITARQVEAGRKAMVRYARGGGKVWVRLFPDKPVTKRPTEVRMGRGKGAVAFQVSVVKPGRILYEIGGVSEAVARTAIAVAAGKMPIRTKFVVSG